MKNFNPFLLIIFSFVIFFSCSESDDNDYINDNTSGLTVFKNQTGDPNADALQAQHVDAEGVLNIYGDFDVEGNPTKVKTLTYQKVGNDTIVNLIFDPDSSLLKTAYTTVNGINSNAIIKFDYPNYNTMSISFYDFDWSNNSSEFIYSLNAPTPFNTLKNTNDWLWFGASIATAAVLVKGAFALAAGAAAGAAAVAAAGVIYPVVAITAALVIASQFIGDANSAEPIPQDIPYPEDTPINNPVSDENNPTEELVNPCADSELEVIIGVDPGNLLVAIVNGDSATYNFVWSTGETDQSGVSSSIIAPEEGEYYVLVEDENSCVAIGFVTVGEIALSGDLDFGNVQVNTSENRTLTISNQSSSPINITSIDFPVGFSANWNGGTLEAGTNIDVIVVFTPTQIQNYSGNITVISDGSQANNTIAVSGTGVTTEIDLSGIWVIEFGANCSSQDYYDYNGTLFEFNSNGTITAPDDDDVPDGEINPETILQVFSFTTNSYTITEQDLTINVIGFCTFNICECYGDSQFYASLTYDTANDVYVGTFSDELTWNYDDCDEVEDSPNHNCSGNLTISRL
jgi:hypothetical protein